MRLRWVSAVILLVVVSLGWSPTAAAAASGTVSVTVQIRQPETPAPQSFNLRHGAIYLFSRLQTWEIGLYR